MSGLGLGTAAMPQLKTASRHHRAARSLPRNARVKRAIREHWKDFAAIVGLLVITVAVAGYILTNERLPIPFISPRTYTLNADFSTAQAVTPGQGQSVRISGRPDRPDHRGLAEERPGRREDEHRQEVRGPDPHQLDGAAPPPHRPRRHVRRAQPRDRERAGGEAGLHDPGLQHDAGRQPRRDPVLARRRQPRVPRPARQRRRPGPAEQRRRSSSRR